MSQQVIEAFQYRKGPFRKAGEGQLIKARGDRMRIKGL